MGPRVRAGVLAFVLAVACTVAIAEPARLAPRSQWIASPSDSDFARVLSPKAAAAKSNGLVTLNCKAADDGALAGCQQVSEFPAGVGLGHAALELAPSIRIGPEPGKRSAAGPVRVPIYFLINRDGAAVMQNPDWAALPTREERLKWAELSPAQQRTRGAASVGCTVDVDGRLANCQILRETPLGKGSGEAALRVAAHLRMFPQLRAGEPVGGAKVTLPFQF